MLRLARRGILHNRVHGEAQQEEDAIVYEEELNVCRKKYKYALELDD